MALSPNVEQELTTKLAELRDLLSTNNIFAIPRSGDEMSHELTLSCADLGRLLGKVHGIHHRQEDAECHCNPW